MLDGLGDIRFAVYFPPTLSEPYGTIGIVKRRVRCFVGYGDDCLSYFKTVIRYDAHDLDNMEHVV